MQPLGTMCRIFPMCELLHLRQVHVKDNLSGVRQGTAWHKKLEIT